MQLEDESIWSLSEGENSALGFFSNPWKPSLPDQTGWCDKNNTAGYEIKNKKNTENEGICGYEEDGSLKVKEKPDQDVEGIEWDEISGYCVLFSWVWLHAGLSARWKSTRMQPGGTKKKICSKCLTWRQPCTCCRGDAGACDVLSTGAQP